MHVLIIEDDSGILESLTEYICSLPNMECDYADNLEEAIAKIENDRYDLILLDIQLKGKNGIAVIDLARKIYPSNPPTMAVISALNTAKQQSEDHKADYFLKKPFDLEMIDELIFKENRK